MAWIKTIDEHEAEGPLKETYDAYMIANKTQKVANVLKLHSPSPESLSCHLELYRNIAYGKGPLRRYQREMIATATSKVNGCFY